MAVEQKAVNDSNHFQSRDTADGIASLQALVVPHHGPNGANGHASLTQEVPALVAARPEKKVSEGKMQAQRYEIKYIIEEQQVERLRDIVLCYIYPDEHTAGKIGRGYPVHSLYLDSPAFRTYQDTEQSVRNRFKVRIRFYDDEPDSPAFLEVKRRRGEIITKTRAMVTKDSVNRYIRNGVLPGYDDLIKKDPTHIAGLYNFTRWCSALDARPAAYTSYYREGFEPQDGNYWRVTFDRDLRTGPITDRLTIAGREGWPRIPFIPGDSSFKNLVFEMKFVNSPPSWMTRLVRNGNLKREAFQKYGRCVETEHPGLLKMPYRRPEYVAEFL